MAYIDWTDELTVCGLHGMNKCWDCLRDHHIKETTQLLDKIVDLKLEMKKVVREACDIE